MTLGVGVLAAVLLMVAPGGLVGRVARLPGPIAIATGPALTYGIVGLAIVPFGAVGIPWNAATAGLALAVVLIVAAILRVMLRRYRDRDAEARAAVGWPPLSVGAGVVVGALLIGYAALRGMPHWQSIPSTWDAVWHANTLRFILDTGQASPTHMGELRNVETHARLYYPSTFHALAAVLAQLTGAAPTTAYTLSSLAAAIWLFAASAAALTWHLLRPHANQWRTAGCAAAAAALSASFTAIPYVEFDTAAMPNLAAYGIAAPTMVLIVSALRHRDRIPVAVSHDKDSALAGPPWAIDATRSSTLCGSRTSSSVSGYLSWMATLGAEWRAHAAAPTRPRTATAAASTRRRHMRRKLSQFRADNHPCRPSR